MPPIDQRVIGAINMNSNGEICGIPGRMAPLFPPLRRAVRVLTAARSGNWNRYAIKRLTSPNYANELNGGVVETPPTDLDTQPAGTGSNLIQPDHLILPFDFSLG